MNNVITLDASELELIAGGEITAADTVCGIIGGLIGVASMGIVGPYGGVVVGGLAAYGLSQGYTYLSSMQPSTGTYFGPFMQPPIT
jgi:ammonia channel protein AmtB